MQPPPRVAPSTTNPSLILSAGQGCTIVTSTVELTRLLTDRKTKESDIQEAIRKHFDPQTFNQTEITIGNEGSHPPDMIISSVALKKLFEHIQTFGSFFPKLRFVNCEFAPDCYQTLIHSLGKLQLLQSLTFESCLLNSQKLVELLSMLITLDQNLLVLSIIRNKIAFDSEVMDCFDIMLQIPHHPLSTLLLDHNGLKEEQILLLAAQLKNNENIHTLSLNGNSVTMKSALALAEWIKSHNNVRTCSLVHTGLNFENREELDRYVDRKPSPFIFMAAPPPAQVVSPNRFFWDTISNAKRYEAGQWDLLTKIADPFERKACFRLWLRIGFNIIDFREREGAMSFFSALALGCGKESAKGIDFLRLTMLYIKGHIHEFAKFILLDFPQIPERVNLVEFFEREIFEKGSWAEHTFRHAIQQVLPTFKIYRSIYLYSPTIKPTITTDGELLPHPSLRVEISSDPGSRLLESPIYLYYDGETQFSLLTRKAKNSDRTP